MLWLSDIFAAMAISQVVVLGIYFLLRHRGRMAILISFFCLCLAAYVGTRFSLVADNTLSSYILFRFATLAPFLIWVIAFLLFVDSGKIPLAAWISMAYFIIFRSVGSAVAINDPEFIASGFGFLLVQLIPQLILFFFSLHTIYLASRGYTSDLVEQRRRLRVIFVACMGILIATIVGMGIVEYFNASQGIPGAFYSAFIFLAALAFQLSAFRLNDEALDLVADSVVSSREAQTVPTQQDAIDPETVQAIRRLMVEEQLYTQPGLTISDLAEALSVQEYRLRRIINRTMRHRNFNQFLNRYRTEDASRRLLTCNNPISSIALDVGYSSLSVFNKAFKERYGMTPSEYRHQHLDGQQLQEVEAD